MGQVIKEDINTLSHGVPYKPYCVYSSNRVLLLEAGPRDQTLGSSLLSWKIHMPAALMYNLCDDRLNW